MNVIPKSSTAESCRHIDLCSEDRPDHAPSVFIDYATSGRRIENANGIALYVESGFANRDI